MRHTRRQLETPGQALAHQRQRVGIRAIRRHDMSAQPDHTPHTERQHGARDQPQRKPQRRPLAGPMQCAQCVCRRWNLPVPGRASTVAPSQISMPRNHVAATRARIVRP